MYMIQLQVFIPSQEFLNRFPDIYVTSFILLKQVRTSAFQILNFILTLDIH